jgi:CAAX prenyl protease-like protein
MTRNFEAVSPQAFSWTSVALSSLAFGLLHGGDWWLPATAAGCIYAAVFLHKGRIGDAVVSHATTNLLITIWVLVRGEWGLW